MNEQQPEPEAEELTGEPTPISVIPTENNNDDNVLSFDEWCSVNQNGIPDESQGESEEMLILEEPFVYSENELIVPLGYEMENVTYCNCQSRVPYLESKLFALKDFIFHKLGITLDDDFTIPPEADENWSSDIIQLEVEVGAEETMNDDDDNSNNEMPSTKVSMIETKDQKVNFIPSEQEEIEEQEGEKETKNIKGKVLHHQPKKKCSKKKKRKKVAQDYDNNYQDSHNDTCSEASSSDLEVTPSKKVRASWHRKYSDEVYDVLNNWLDKHMENPYLSSDDNKSLQKATGLTSNQITTWINNKRRRCPKLARAIAKAKKKMMLDTASSKKPKTVFVTLSENVKTEKPDHNSKFDEQDSSDMSFSDDNCETILTSSKLNGVTTDETTNTFVKKSNGASPGENILKEQNDTNEPASCVSEECIKLGFSSPTKKSEIIPATKGSDELEICKVSIGCSNCDLIFESIFDLARHRATHLRVNLTKLKSSILKRLHDTIKTENINTDDLYTLNFSEAKATTASETKQSHQSDKTIALDTKFLKIEPEDIKLKVSQQLPEPMLEDSCQPGSVENSTVLKEESQCKSAIMDINLQYKHILGETSARVILYKLTEQEIKTYETKSKKPRPRQYKKKRKSVLYVPRKKRKITNEERGRRSPRIVELNKFPVKKPQNQKQISQPDPPLSKQKHPTPFKDSQPRKVEKKHKKVVRSDQGGKSPKKLFKAEPPKCSTSVILQGSRKTKEKKKKHKHKKHRVETKPVRKLFPPPSATVTSEIHQTQWPYSYAVKSTPAPAHQNCEAEDSDEEYSSSPEELCDTEIIDSNPIGIDELDRLQAQGRVVNIRSDLFNRCMRCDRVFENQLDLVMHSLDHGGGVNVIPGDDNGANSFDVPVTLNSPPHIAGSMVNVTSTLPIIDTVADTPIEVEDPTVDLLINDDPLFNELSLSFIQPQIVEPVKELVLSSEDTPPVLTLQDISSAAFHTPNYELNGFGTNGGVPNPFATTIPSPYKMNGQTQSSRVSTEYVKEIYKSPTKPTTAELFSETSTNKTIPKSKNGIRNNFF